MRGSALFAVFSRVGTKVDSPFHFVTDLTDIRQHGASTFGVDVNVCSTLNFATNLTDVRERSCIVLDRRTLEGRAFIEEGSLCVWALEIILGIVVG